MRKTAISTLAVILLALFASPGNAEAGNFLDKLLDHVGDAAKREVRTRVEAASTTAEVGYVDRHERPSFVVRTTDGRTFQLRTLSVVGDLEKVVPAIAAGGRVDFRRASRGGRGAYRMLVESVDLGIDGSGILGEVLGGAVGDALSDDDGMMRVEILALTGTALDGSRWALDVTHTTLRSIEQLR
jgi:hypothetical protein